MRVCPPLRSLYAVLVVAALVQAAPAPAQQPGTEGEPFRVTIGPPAKQSTIPPEGDISFAANKDGASFTCRLGAGTTGPCTSPIHYGPLQPGQTLPFAVFGSLPGERGNSDKTVYTIGQVAPPALAVTITSAPSGEVDERAATISFTANRPEAAFRCTLDGVVAACASPQRYRDLSPGTHVFTVLAVAGDETSKPARASWTVAAVIRPPQSAPRAVITSAPEGTVTSRQARLAFTATPAAARFQCSLDGSAFVACRSPRTYPGLSRSPHRFRVRALSASGAPGRSAIARWTVGPPPPPSTAKKERPDSLVIVVLVALAALLVAMLAWSLRRIGRARRRAAWQLEAQAEPPEKPCSKRSHYCQKTQVKLKPGRRRIAYLVLRARDDDQAELERHIGGRLVSQLNDARRDYRRDQDRDRLRTTLVPVAGLLVREIELWLGDDAVHHEVAADAHLIAAELEYEFALYCCKGRDDRPEWEKEDEWTASVEDESEASAVRLDRAEPLGAKVESATDQLTEFVMEVDRPASVRASTEGSLTF